jgi:3-oxoacyl-[acyl-carrier protein] reductase
MRLKDKVAIITGGASGIGKATADAFAAEGAIIVIADINVTAIDSAVAQFRKKGVTATGHVCDVSNRDDAHRLMKSVDAEFGRIDILVNNAALVGPNMPTWEYPPAAFAQVVHVGLIGTFNCCRAIVPHMRERNYGRIVNLSSIAGKEGNPNAVAYSSMKAAVIALTKSLGKELAGRNIAVNCVTPAVAKTPGAMEQSPQHIEYMLAKIPRGRMLELGEAASMICWLASEENSFTTGAVFDLSGGRATY